MAKYGVSQEEALRKGVGGFDRIDHALYLCLPLRNSCPKSQTPGVSLIWIAWPSKWWVTVCHVFGTLGASLFFIFHVPVRPALQDL